MLDTRPTVCNICGGHVSYGKMKDFGITPYQSGYCYHCDACNAYVGTHKNRKEDALGILAYGNTRHLRKLCHKEMDKHYYSTKGKNLAYYMLSRELGIRFDDCHFGQMDNGLLVKSLQIMKGWNNLCLR